jgi:hypothetical protein
MPVFPAGTEPDREYHRLQPITSDPESRTEAERLESLRKAACNVGGDAVIEAVNEEVRTEDARYSLVSSGTAVVWTRTGGEVKPLTTVKKKEAPAPEQPSAEPETPASEATAEPEAPAPASTGKSTKKK